MSSKFNIFDFKSFLDFFFTLKITLDMIKWTFLIAFFWLLSKDMKKIKSIFHQNSGQSLHSAYYRGPRLVPFHLVQSLNSTNSLMYGFLPFFLFFPKEFKSGDFEFSIVSKYPVQFQHSSIGCETWNSNLQSYLSKRLNKLSKKWDSVNSPLRSDAQTSINLRLFNAAFLYLSHSSTGHP